MAEEVELYERIAEDPEAALPGLGWKNAAGHWQATEGETPCCASSAKGHLYLYPGAPYCVKCFKCGKATAITSVLTQEGRAYGEALDELRRRLRLPGRVLSDGERGRQEEADRRAELLEAYLAFSQENLPQCPQALQYLESRPKSPWTLEEAQKAEFGAAPPYREVQKWQKEKGYTYNDLVALNLAGEAVRRGRIDGRVVIPCRSGAGGRLEGLALRSVDGEEPRYWQVGKKAHGAGLWSARGKGPRCLIVEGDFDAAAVKLRMSDTPVIALSNKVLEPETVAAAVRLGLRDFYLALDFDMEGQEAIGDAVRAVYQFQAQNPTPAASGVAVYVVDAPSLAAHGKDADQWTRTEEGKAALLEAIHTARVGWKWALETQFLPQWERAQTDPDKGEVFRDLKEFVAALPPWVANDLVEALPDALGELPAAAAEAAAEAERIASTRQDAERLARKAEADLRKFREEEVGPEAVAALLRRTAEGLDTLTETTRPSPVSGAAIRAAAAGLGEGRYCGWGKLEKMGWRLRPAELTIVAARPGCGKTTFLSNLVVNVLKDPGAGPVLLIQAELALWQAMAFLLAPYAAGRPGGRGWSTGEIIRQFASEDWEEDLQEVVLSFEQQAAKRLYVVTAPPTPGQVAALAATLEKDHGQPLALVGVDYLELLLAEGKQETAEQRVSAIADGLLAVAKEQRVPVVALSQFNREASESEGGQVEMLRYSDRLGALASTVLSLALSTDEGKGQVDLKVVARKNRYGPKGQWAFLSWDRGRGYIYEK